MKRSIRKIEILFVSLGNAIFKICVYLKKKASKFQFTFFQINKYQVLISKNNERKTERYVVKTNVNFDTFHSMDWRSIYLKLNPSK